MCNHFCSLFLRWDKIKRISNASVRSHRKAENHTTSLRLSIINPMGVRIFFWTILVVLTLSLSSLCILLDSCRPR